MKKFVIIGLICLNVGLLLALASSAWAATPAQAQVVVGGKNYMVLTAKVRSDEDAVIITDLDTRRTLAFRYDNNKKDLVPFRGIKLDREFGRVEE